MGSQRRLDKNIVFMCEHGSTETRWKMAHSTTSTLQKTSLDWIRKKDFILRTM